MNRKIIFSIGTFLAQIYLVALCLVLLSAGCQKNEASIPASKDKEKPVKPEKPNPATATMVPTHIKAKNLQVELKYEGETNRLTELIQSDGVVSKFFYSPNGIPLRGEYYKENKLQMTSEYMVNKDGQIYKVLLLDSRPASLGSYTIIYNEEKQISQIRKYNPANKLTEEEVITYDSLGNANTVVLTNNGKATTMSINYDDRAGIYHKIPYVQLLLLPLQNPRVNLSKNNPIGIAYPSGDLKGSSYTYEYNSSGYPSTLEVKQGADIETLKLTYKTFKPVN